MRVLKRIVAAAGSIAESEFDGNCSIAFLPAVLCSVALPRSRITEINFSRMSGKASLSVTAGCLWDGEIWEQQHVPYGPMARLLFAYICTQAVQRRTRDISIGDSAAEFLRAIGKSPSGGHAASVDLGRPARGAYAALYSQAKALAASSIQLGFQDSNGPVTESSRLISRFEAWSRSSDRCGGLSSPNIQLSADFAEILTRHAVPFDLRALIALNSSAMAMDAYVWLAYRLYRLDVPLTLSWMSLKSQFGQEYRELRDFKRQMKEALARALAVYPTANVEGVTGGIVLKPSPPPIAPTSVHRSVRPNSYPRDIAPHLGATLPPIKLAESRDITPHIKPLASPDSKAVSRTKEKLDNAPVRRKVR